MSKWSRYEVEAAAALAARNLGFTELLSEQKIITAYVEGQDVFGVSLLTGFGKTLCFANLPGILAIAGLMPARTVALCLWMRPKVLKHLRQM